MSRHLLIYDSSCPECTGAAREVYAASHGALLLRGIDEPEIRAMLDTVRPGWRRRPMLLHDHGDHVDIHTGAGMAVRLTRMLGVRGTIGLLRSIASQPEAGPASPASGLSRRTVLGRAALALGGALFGSKALAAASAMAQSKSAPAHAARVTDAAKVSTLKSNQHVRAAVRSFGEPAWDEVVFVSGRPGTYVLNHPGHVFTALSEDGDTAVAYAVRSGDSGGSLRWMTTAGVPYAVSSLDVSRERVHTTRLPDAFAAGADAHAAEAAVRPPTAFVCWMTYCLNVCLDASCLQNCFFCMERKAISCIQCAACAGPKAVSCARRYGGGARHRCT